MTTPKDMQIGTVHKSNRCGDVTILHYENSLNVIVEFINTGTKIKQESASIRKGYLIDPLAPTVYGIGYLGIGSYRKKTHKLLYRKWSDMLMRCYSEKYLTKYPTYKGCSVCKEWLNFQTFAAWGEVNWIEGYDLDKDIKVEGNRIYSPESCMFVSREDNMKHANDKRENKGETNDK